ncbi:TNF receptor-associated factor 5-like [Dysidea avara]|uniref:TNF receptor-associated factor 5-like n=1 Tax=Dysidea avara TaxID=196820 RepID=UPI00332518A3
MAVNVGCQGGYEYDFVDAPPDRVVCKICHYPCRDAHLTNCCGAHFCASCLKQTRKGSAVNKACPMCRVEKFKVFPNKQLDREIKGLKVHCSNRKTGCIWQGEINDFTKHVDDDCQFVDVECPSGCDTKLKRQCVKDHLNNDCPCYCKYCNTSGHSDWISSRHKEHCDMYPIPCPNRCELGVTRSVGIEEHRKVCPLEVVQCEYYDVGCDVKLIQKDLEHHVKSKMAEHLNLMRCNLVSTTEQLRKTEKKLITVEKDLEDTKETLGSTKLNYDKLNVRLAAAESQLTGINTKTDKLKDVNSKLQRSLLHKRYIGNIDENELPTIMASHDEMSNFFISRFSNVLIMFCLVLMVFVAQISVINNRLEENEQKVWPELLDQKSKLSTSSNQVAPVIFKISNFNRLEEDDHFRWSSHYFFAFENGYEMFLIVRFDTINEEKKMVVSLLFKKNMLQQLGYWPIRTMFTVEVLNQVYSTDHYVTLVRVENTRSCHITREDKNLLTCSVVFISTQFLKQKADEYLKNNTAYVRVSHTEGLYYYIMSLINYLVPFNVFIKFVWFAMVSFLTMECLEVFEHNFKTSRYANWMILQFLFQVIRIISVLCLYWYIYKCSIAMY